MTIAHGLWCPGHLYLDDPAETFAFVGRMLLIRAGLSVLVLPRNPTATRSTESPWRPKRASAGDNTSEKYGRVAGFCECQARWGMAAADAGPV